jgi:hypothetical protein
MRQAARVAVAAVLSLASSSLVNSSRADDGLPLPPKPSPAASAAPTDVDIGFDPRTDAPLFSNDGDYRLGPMSDCFGMSLVAIDNFKRRMAATGPIPERQSKVTDLAAQGDLHEEELAALVAEDANETYAGPDGPKIPKDSLPTNPKAILAALARIQKTGVPETLMMTMGPPGPYSGHVTVLYGYKAGKLRIYDPNFPGETIEWPFDPKKGLGPHPKGQGPFKATYGAVHAVTPVPIDRLKASGDIAAIRSAVYSSAASTKDFATVTVKLAPGANADDVVLSGTVSRGLKMGAFGPSVPPSQVWFKINGELVANPVQLQKDGSYSVTLSRSSFTETSDVSVVATTKPFRYMTAGALAGFTEQKLDLPRSEGFVKKLEPGARR